MEEYAPVPDFLAGDYEVLISTTKYPLSKRKQLSQLQCIMQFGV
jgi:hypothetical protein